MSKPREDDDDAGPSPSNRLARHKVTLAADGIMPISYASQQIRLKKGGVLGVRTQFQSGDFYEAELIRLLRPKGGVESAVDVAEHHWREMKAELQQIQDEVGLYAQLKTRGRHYEEVANEMMMMSVGQFAEQWEMSRTARRREMDTGLESSAYHPHTTPGERLAWFRMVINGSPEPTVQPLRLDQVERSLLRVGKMFREAAGKYAEFVSDGPSEQAEGGMMMREGKPPRRIPTPMEMHAAAFFRGIDEVMEAGSGAWWSAAAKIVNNEKLDPAEVKAKADVLNEKINAVKAAFQRLENDVADSHMAYEFGQLKELVTGHDENQHKGLIPTMDKMYGIVSRENILQSAIEAGRAPLKGKK
jgi:hypothetical protein